MRKEHLCFEKRNIHSPIDVPSIEAVASISFLIQSISLEQAMTSTKVKFRALILVKVNKCHVTEDVRWEHQCHG